VPRWSDEPCGNRNEDSLQSVMECSYQSDGRQMKGKSELPPIPEVKLSPEAECCPKIVFCLFPIAILPIRYISKQFILYVRQRAFRK
jgi:hypothetical protein